MNLANIKTTVEMHVKTNTVLINSEFLALNSKFISIKQQYYLNSIFLIESHQCSQCFVISTWFVWTSFECINDSQVHYWMYFNC